MGMLAPILLVEDSADHTFVVRRALARAGMERPLVALPDGQAAIDYLGGTGAYADRNMHPLPAFVLLDLILPILDGFDVLEWRRTDAVVKAVPVIAYTILGLPATKELATQLGADDYVIKPVEFDQLVHALSDVAWRWGNPAPGESHQN